MMTSIFSLLLLSLGIVVFAYLGYVLAQRRGLTPRFWGAMGGLLGPLVIPVILLSRPKNKNSE